MRKAVILSSLFLGVVFLLAETPVAPKKTPSKSIPKKTAAKRKSGVKKAPQAVQSWRTTQRTPTPERYKEIQQALATKGYLQTNAPSGVWDSSSVVALKKFQQDQNLDPSGKIDSLSLIALGLGPRREPQAAPQQQ